MHKQTVKSKKVIEAQASCCTQCPKKRKVAKIVDKEVDKSGL